MDRSFQAEQKMAAVKRIFSQFKLPVEIQRASALHPNKYSVAVNGAVTGYLEPEKQSMEGLLALATSLIFRGMYKSIRKRVKDREKLADAAYYHVIGQLGVDVRFDVPEESRRKPAWLKKFPKYNPLSAWSYDSCFHVDHVFYSRDGEYVSEPYTMSMSEFESLAKFCREHGLEFHVRGESRHFPGHTFRVVIYPKKEA